MALWKEQAASPAPQPVTPATREPERGTAVPINADNVRRAERSAPKESLIAADLTIEGKIEGAGHMRIAGRFKGDVHVDGDLTVEPGAHLTGQVYARTVIVGGELHGNIAGAVRVELLDSGLVVGDIKAGTLTVAGGSRVRGQVECGWEDKSVKALAAG
jgi:cytoskeletal protein CcmA (bactofilin family)